MDDYQSIDKIKIKPELTKTKHLNIKSEFLYRKQKYACGKQYEKSVDLHTYVNNSYQHLEVLKNIPGYVVNIYDAVNFDIDLYIPTIYKGLYKNVIRNSYTFTDVGQESKVLTRSVFRCRLRGIQMMKDSSSTKKRSALCDVIQRIDKQNGWVICDLGDIDIYKRILVDVYDPITGKPITDILLSDDYSDIFNKYKAKI